MDTDVMVLGVHCEQRFTFSCDRSHYSRAHIDISKTSCTLAALEIIPEIELVNITKQIETLERRELLFSPVYWKGDSCTVQQEGDTVPLTRTQFCK